MGSYRLGVSLVVCAIGAIGCKDTKPTTGSLIVDISGLPATAQADVRVTGPNEYNEVVPSTKTLEKLPPGEYTVTVREVTFDRSLYTSAITSQKHTIVVGQTETANIPYGLASGIVDVRLNGLPEGTSTSIWLTGPNGFTKQVFSSGLVGPLIPGTYLVRSDTVASAVGDRFATPMLTQSISITASLTPVPVSLDYVIISGTLDLSVTGLPSSTDPPPVTVTGPNGFQRKTASSLTLRGLAPGSYTVASTSVLAACPNMYYASQSQLTRSVQVGATESAAVTYTFGPAVAESLNVKIDNVHITQATQNYAGNVPILAGKPALLRVFAVANQCNSAKPDVRVTLSANGSVIATHTISASANSIGLSPNQGELGSSWNVLLPTGDVRTGLSIVAEIDPDNQLGEQNRSDNRFPESGSRDIDVRAHPTVGLRFVPVVQSNNLTGDVSTANTDGFLDLGRRIHPVGTYDVDIREPYTTGQPPLQANDGNGSWIAILNEINSLRSPDGSNRYYYGVVRVGYSSGVAGIAFIGGKAALGWDFQQNSSASLVFAHELGHNFGRFHTPTPSSCGVPAGVDPNYPNTGDYSGGRVGQFGFDFTTSSLKSSTLYDIMGYCNDVWVSDYTYVGMLTRILSVGPTLPLVASNASQPSLLIWGRIVNGQPILEPAFEITARPVLPAAAGPHRVTALGNKGEEIFSLSFSGERIADNPADAELFSFVVPISALRGRELASLRLTSRGRSVTSVAASDAAADPAVALSRTGPRSVRVTWNASRFPVVMVRDPVSGQILSFARGGDMTIATERDDLEINYSNRVRSNARRVRLR